jgi:hypothetical protein
MEDRIAALKAKYAKIPPIITKKGGIKLEDNKPITFFVLFPETGEYSKRGIWVRPLGVHFVKGKQIVCSKLEETSEPCYICERIDELRAQGKDVFPYLAPEKYAMNVLERGEGTSRVFLAPSAVGREIIEIFDAGLHEENTNIFDPMKSTVWTVTRFKQDGTTQHTTDFEVEPVPIITGDNIEERISRILRAGANLDLHFKRLTLQEQRAPGPIDDLEASRSVTSRCSIARRLLRQSFGR